MSDEELKEKYDNFRRNFDYTKDYDYFGQIKRYDRLSELKKIVDGAAYQVGYLGIAWHKVVDKLFYKDLLYPLLDAAYFFSSVRYGDGYDLEQLHYADSGDHRDQPYNSVWAALSGTLLVSYDFDFLRLLSFDITSSGTVPSPDYEILAALQTSSHLLDRIALYIIDLVAALYNDDPSFLDSELFGLSFHEFTAAVIPDLEYNRTHPENPRGTKQHNLDQIKAEHHKLRIIYYRKKALSQYAENPSKLIMPPRDKFIDFTQSGYSNRGKDYYYEMTKERFQKVWDAGYNDPYSHILKNSSVRKSLSGKALEYTKKADAEKDAAIMPVNSSLNSERLSTKR